MEMRNLFCFMLGLYDRSFYLTLKKNIMYYRQRNHIVKGHSNII